MAENARGGGIRRVDSPSRNNIACEPCRTRKRRCDRSLPVCLQCANDPSLCHYPEENKRGLPPGYVNKLEARLADTEAALYHLARQNQSDSRAMSELPYAIPASISVVQNKTDRIKEWDRFPLQSALDVQAWYRWKTGDDGSGASPAMTSASSAPSQMSQPVNVDVQWPADARQQQAWANDSPMSRDSQPAAALTARSDGAVYATQDAGPSRAKELSESKKTIYF